MSYEKQNFEDGQVLKAEHLNHIEEGIDAISTAVLYMEQSLTEEQKAQARVNIGAVSQTQNVNLKYLPLVVDEMGAVVPSLLTPIGIYGVNKTAATIGEDITTGRKADCYVLGSVGSATSNASLGISTAIAPIETGKYYLITAWDNPNTQVNCLGFFSSMGGGITGTTGYLGENVTQSVTFDVIDAENGVYGFVAPENAVMVKYSFWEAKGGYCCQVSGDKYLCEWLAINGENLTDGAKESVCQYMEDKKSLSDYHYDHSIAKPIELQNKSCVAFGDSITFGITSPSLTYTYAPYIKTVADKFNMSLTNLAVSGTCIADSSDAENSIYKKIMSYEGNAEVVVVSGGVNDYNTGKALGEYFSTDTTTFYGALRVICQFLKANHSTATVIFITPINCTMDSPRAIHTLGAYRNAIFEIATEYGFNVVDGSRLGFPAQKGGFQEFMLTDGCHPTQAGHDFYAKNLCSILG